MKATQRTTKQHDRVRELYYITHIDNVPSILRNGIFSHENIEAKGIKYTPIYDEEIVSRRKEIRAPNGKSLWSFANLYFNARNPMLYRVICEKPPNDVAVIGIAPKILNRLDIYVTTGNAVHSQSKILQGSQKVISEVLKDTSVDWWNEADGTKRKIMAECLIPDVVPPDYITSIYVSSYEARNRAERSLSGSHGLSIIYEPRMFFQHSVVKSLTNKLFLVRGDMFFSRMQTITVSVNVVGIMGKGVASRAKYQFPDVYVYYQDLCRKRQLKMGTPLLYKREASTDYQLADEPSTLSCANSETWFLLFPTKRHWRDQADLQGIENGLKWLCENYKKNGIKSLAIPSLGCGLGRLEWKDVGPLLCKYLSILEIPVLIYLPAERDIPENLLTEEFLLSRGS